MHKAEGIDSMAGLGFIYKKNEEVGMQQKKAGYGRLGQNEVSALGEDILLPLFVTSNIILSPNRCCPSINTSNRPGGDEHIINLPLLRAKV